MSTRLRHRAPTPLRCGDSCALCSVRLRHSARRLNLPAAHAQNTPASPSFWEDTV